MTVKYKTLASLQNQVQSLKGKWELSPNHKLTYRERNGKKTARFKGSLVAAEPKALVVSVTVQERFNPNPQRIGTDSARARRSRPIRTRTVTGLVKLSGKWQLDLKNRITFFIKRGSRKYDKLTFQGMWEVNKRNEIVYSYETQQVLRGRRKKRRRVRKVTHRLTFRGVWDISDKHCLTYTLAGDSQSVFRIRGTFQTKNVRAKKGQIRYQAGIEYKTSRGNWRRAKRTITLFGKWKLSHGVGLSFEIKYSGRRKSEIRFGTKFNLEKFQKHAALLPDEVTVDLVGKQGKPVGLEVVFTKDFFRGEAQSFIRLRKAFKETAVEGGVKLLW